ncbi:MAG: recombinase family protein [Paracoccus sp. (in: a-proteobacteria)]|uniref:recombinase family protein n=1 Tax=Paracoccus sp. TaxID=267 RepID=UPI0039E5F876
MKVGYARVSTEEQNLDLQRAALRLAGCRMVFEDHAVSGATHERPGLAQAMDVLGPGDVLVVWKLDRLSRSLAHLVKIIDELGRCGIGFASLTESIDTTSPGGRFLFHIMAALAEFERALIAERTRAGMVAARERGKTLGRPRKLSDTAVAQARLAVAETGKPVARVASEMGVDASTLRRAFKRG